MKSANIINTSTDSSGITRATVEIESDSGVKYTVTNLGPLPIYDGVALWQELAKYDAAYWIGKSSADTAPVVNEQPVIGQLTPPIGG